MIKLEVKSAALPKLKAIQTELEATQGELEAAQAELEAIQNEWEISQAELQASQRQVAQLRERLQELKRQQVKAIHESRNSSSGNERYHSLGWTLLPMRVFLGLTFIYAGIQKLTDPQFFNPSMPGYIATQIKGMAHGSPLHDFLIGVALPHAVLFGWMTALGEIAIGLGTYAGFLFRPAAFFGMLLSLMFFLSASWNTYPYFFGSDIVFVFCWVTMILSGPLNTGLASLDDWITDQLLARSNAGENLPFILQLYILLVVAGAPHKSSYTISISLLRANPIIGSRLQTLQHKSSKTQNGQKTRRAVIHEWVIGAATVASVTLLGIPLRIFGNNPNDATTTSTPNTTSTTSTAITPDTSSPSSTAVASNTTSTPTPNTTPLPVKPVSIGQTIASISAIPANSSVSFIIASSQDSAVLIHLPNGQFVAYDATCTHAGCPVVYKPDTHTLVCPCHGSQFDPARNGATLQGPAIAPLSPLGIQIDNSTGVIKLKSVPS